jgi:hypothetical protein
VPPPLQTGPPPQPGAFDVTNQRFSSPLSLIDAQRILLDTRIFGYGDANRQIQAYNLLLDQPDAKARFQSIAIYGRWAGQLYSLCALEELDAVAAEELARRLSTVRDAITVFESDVVSERPVADLVSLIKDRKLAPAFRRLKEEATKRFDKRG